MAWAPTKQIFDLVPIADNLLGYIETNDADALSWANGGPGLAEFAATYTNASGRLQTMFPSLLILTQECEADLSGEVLVGGLQLVVEGTVSGSNPDTLVLTTKKYAKAVESMLANIPAGTLTASTSPTISQASLFEVETRLDVIRGQVSPSAFIQIFQIRCVYKLVGRAF